MALSAFESCYHNYDDWLLWFQLPCIYSGPLIHIT